MIIFWGRIPSWYADQLNPDEGFAVAAAISLKNDPIYWRSVVGTTHGPLLHYILLIPSFFGFRIDFGSARAVGAMLLSLGCFFSYLGTEKFTSRKISILGHIPALLFLGFSPYWDFQAYNGEHMLVTVCGLGIYLISILYVNWSNAHLRNYLILGFSLGCIPFIKMQGVLLGVLFGVSGIVIALFAFPFKKALTMIGALSLSSLVPCFFVLLFTYAFGVFDMFWHNAVLYNIFYAGRGGGTLIQNFSYFYPMVSLSVYSQMLIENVGNLSLNILLLSAVLSPSTCFKEIFLLIFSLLLYVLAWVSVVLPGNLYTHYLLIASLPAVFLFSVSIFLAFKTLNSHAPLLAKRFSFLSVALFGWYLFYIPGMYVLRDGKGQFQPPTIQQKNAPWALSLQLATSVADENDSVVIWGWSDNLYVRLGLPSATRYPNIFLHGKYSPKKMQDYFYKSYVKDITDELPPIIITAVGRNVFGFNNKKNDSLFRYPEMKKIMMDHYVFFGKDRDIEVYVRKKRVERIKNLFSQNIVNDLLEKEILLLPQRKQKLSLALNKLLSHSHSSLTFEQLTRNVSEMIKRGEANKRDQSILKAKILLGLRARNSMLCLRDLSKCVDASLSQGTHS